MMCIHVLLPLTCKLLASKDLAGFSFLLIWPVICKDEDLHCVLVEQIRLIPQKIKSRLLIFLLFSQDQHTLLVKYQGLVVKHLVSQNKKIGQGDDPLSDELDREQEDTTNTTRKELQELSSAIKDLVLKSRKSSVTEE